MGRSCVWLAHRALERRPLERVLQGQWIGARPNFVGAGERCGCRFPVERILLGVKYDVIQF